MDIMTLKAIRRSPLAVLTITNRIRTINALKMIQAMTVPHSSPAEARTLSEIAEKHHTTVSKLRKLKKIKGSSIRAGKKIRVK